MRVRLVAAQCRGEHADQSHVALGVEAYVGKFASVGPFAHKPPFERPITDLQALTRTGHVLIGLTLLASLVALAIRVYRNRTMAESVKQSDLDAMHRPDAVTELEPVAV